MVPCRNAGDFFIGFNQFFFNQGDSKDETCIDV